MLRNNSATILPVQYMLLNNASQAGVAELADAQDLGSCERSLLWVRVPPPAPLTAAPPASLWTCRQPSSRASSTSCTGFVAVAPAAVSSDHLVMPERPQQSLGGLCMSRHVKWPVILVLTLLVHTVYVVAAVAPGPQDSFTRVFAFGDLTASMMGSFLLTSCSRCVTGA